MNETQGFGESLIDKTAAAALLGVSVRTVEAWVQQKRVPFVKMGEGRRAPVRFRPEALRDWVRAQETPAEGEEHT